MSRACPHEPPCVAGHLCSYSAAVARVRGLEAERVDAAEVQLVHESEIAALRSALCEALDGWASWVAHPEPLAIIARLRARFGVG